MGAQRMLEQLLKGGLGNLGGLAGPGGLGGLGSAVGLPKAPGTGTDPRSPEPQQAWGGFAGGAVTGGALGLLLGSKRGRGIGAQVAKVGGVAALGALAYKAYTAWQAQQAAAGQPPAEAARVAPALAAPVREDELIHRAAPAQAEQQARALLAAMIAAAKADGHVDEAERGRLDEALQRLDDDPDLHRFVAQQLRRPLDPAEVAALSTGPALAAEIYLASLVIADETSTMERLYLDELGRQLALPEGLRRQLEAQVAG